ncbi:MAG: hypothetical protein WCE79_10970 [Xanthobacteraceae bacterium]
MATIPIPDGLGPYEMWNFGTGSDFVFSGAQRSSRYLSALVELQRAQGILNPTPTGPAVKVWLPTLWKADKTRHDPFALRYVPFILRKPEGSTGGAVDPLTLRNWLLEGLSQNNIQPYLQYVDIARSRFRVGLPMAEGAMKELNTLEPTEPDWEADPEIPTNNGTQKRITIFAVIDDGLPFAHRNFRDASGKRTRVEFCWLQSAKAKEEQTSVLFGREYLRDEIEQYIADHGDDEDKLYRVAGVTDDTEGLASMIERHTTHGAHVMDLATGYAPERGEQPAEEIRIIGVQLPNVVTMDTSGVGKDMSVLSAFHYIFDRTDRIAEKYGIDRPRLVINFSYGYFGGPHDGQLDVEAAISELIATRRETRGPTALVLPAGNSFLDRMHAAIPETRFANGGEARIRWRLQPADRTPNFVEIWFPSDFNPFGYTVEVKDSGGVVRGSLPVGVAGGITDRICELSNRNGKQVGQLSADQHKGPKGRWRVLVVTAPSEPEDEKHPRVEAGAWTIAIKRESGAATLGVEFIHCWIQRDTDPASLRTGARQSYFDDPDDVRYNDDGSLRELDTHDALIRRFGSLSGLATARHAMAVAGFRLGAGLGSSLDHARPVPYSCAGAENTAWSEARITCSSMSDRAKALPGTVAAGTRSGARSVLQGTSAAAPFVARQLATTFMSASDEDVANAENENYLGLLQGPPPNFQKHPPATRHTLEDRLGAVLVAPHWQPAMEK